MKPKKRSFSISGHKTSISIEEPFWLALRDIAREEHLSLAALVGRIDKQRQATNLSSAIRIYILMHYRAMAEGAGHGAQTLSDTEIPRSGSTAP